MIRKRYKYLFTIILSICSVSILYGNLNRNRISIPLNNQIQSVEEDTLPLFPVKKTQPQTPRDIEVKKPIDLEDPSNIKTEVIYDDKNHYYIFRTKVGDQVLSTPFSMTPSEYTDFLQKKSMNEYFKNKNLEAFLKGGHKEDYTLKGMKIDLSPKDKLFGPGGLRFNVNGYVETSMGIKKNTTKNPTLSDRNRSKSAFYFDENMQINADAKVGDKINFGLNYDTESMFDFDSKKIKLAYDAAASGDEDGILRRIEAGNVSMATTNSLINGGTSLFGITTEMQFGRLKINSVISQQESESRTIDTQGSIQNTEYEFKADNYDENRHFFLAYYFRDNYNKALSTLPFIQSPIKITKIEVWITNRKGNFEQARNIVAFSDLAENKHIHNHRWTSSGGLDIPYNGANNLYQTVAQPGIFSGIRDKSQVTAIAQRERLESGMDYEKIESARLLNSTEYIYDSQLGYISLNSALQPDEVLAVAYEYQMQGKTYKVGELSTDIVDNYDPANPKSGALMLKLLKPISLSPRSYTWNLMMKNVYYLGATSIQKEGFRLNISYQSDTIGTYINYIPEGKIKNKQLLKVMNLDRLDSRGNARKGKDGETGDGIFDFVEGYTIRSENGRIYFPVLEPFGRHLRNEIGDSILANKYVYQELYDSTLTVAQQIAEKNKFKIYGTYRGSNNSAIINLNATNIPQGSVKITAGGVLLTENVDYIVDYISGTATIINQNILDSNTPTQVTLEDRTMGLMNRKTLMGLNLNYELSKNFNIGATIMHLSEKPYTLRTTLGQESVKNTLWGLNTSYSTQSQILTNLIDKLPFVNATQPSQISLNAEFANLIAGHYQNSKVGGYSYLDDFETSQTRIDLKSPYAWTLASTPNNRKRPGADQPAYFPESSLNDSIDYGKNRAMLSWFTIDPLFTRKNSSLTPQHIKNDKEQLSNHFVREIYTWELYPNRDMSYNEAGTLPVLNLSYYPKERGPYNLDARDIDSNGNLLDPKRRWGGIMRKMDIRDFEASNVEYIEFWLMDPFVYDLSRTNKGGDLYFNLGDISEDVLKDGKKFYENGLPVNNEPDAVEYTTWGKVPKRQSTVYAFDNNLTAEQRRMQDVGLNGLSSEEEMAYPTYANYLAEYRNKLSAQAIEQQLQNPFSPFNDPAKDNFRYYRGAYYDENQTSILNRYKFYNGTEGNTQSLEGMNEKYSTAGRRVPDVEDIDQDYTMNENESYYQYRVSLTHDSLQVGRNNIVDARKVKVPLRNGKEGEITWYQFKIPIRNGKRVNDIRDFKSIRYMRMFLTNFEDSIMLRFGSLQLVRGEWRTYERSLNVNNMPSGKGTINLSTVNIEENGNREPVNYVVPPGVSRMSDPDQAQMIKDNEQSLSLQIKGLEAQDARAVYKNIRFDMRKYKRIQMFVHAESPMNNYDLKNGELTVFMRLGSDYQNNYYEYEIPLELTPHGRYSDNNAEAVWPKANMFDFPLELFKNLKLNRNREKRKAGSTVTYTTLYSEYDGDKPGNKVSVIGNPTLGEVNVILIGVRNNSRNDKSGEVWVDELRLNDFDDKGGWAAQGDINISFSDIGSLNMAGRKETAGFGALDQSMNERRQDDYSMYNIALNLDLGRFVPEKAKLSVPFYYTHSNQTIKPEYDPFNTDVKLKESLKVVNTKAEKDSIRSIAEEKITTQTLSLSNVKVNIKSKTPMPYDPANFNFGYSHSKSETNNPTTVYDVAKEYKLTAGYNYTPLMKTWEPFKNVKSGNGAAQYAKSIGINYLPSNISLNSNISRYYTETMLRDLETYALNGNNNRFLSWSQEFYWDRDFSINWDLTRNLKFGFKSGTRAEIEEPYMQVNKKLNKDHYDEWRDSVWQSIKSLGTPLSYRQMADVTLQLPFQNIPAMNWLNSNINYSSKYNWDRGAKTQTDSLEIGNTLSNNMTLTFTNRLNMVQLYNKSRWLKKVNERFDARRSNKSDQNRKKQKEADDGLKRKYSQTIFLSSDTTYTLTHNLGTKKFDILARTNGKRYNLKYKKKDNNTIIITNKDSAEVLVNIVTKGKEDKPKLWEEVAEYSARGLMSLRSLGINYSKRKETYISGFKPFIGDVFGQKNSEYGLVPGLGFAFGFEGGDEFINKSLERDWLVMNTMNINPAVYNNAETIELKAQIEPIKGLRIELNANRQTNNRTEVQYMYEGKPRKLGGSFSMTTIAISSSLRSSNAKNNYHSEAFDNFLKNREIIHNRMEQKYNGVTYPTGGFMSELPGLAGKAQYQPGNNIGTVNPNSADVLIPAFISAYTGKNAGKISLSAFPSLRSLLPNWSVSYDGLTSVSSIKKYFKTIRLNHSYICVYQIGSYDSFSDWVDAGGDALGFIRDVLNGNPIPSSPYNISSVSINEMFNPLFGINSVLNNNMIIDLRYNHNRLLNLNIPAYQIIETLQKDWVFGLGYRINEFNRIVGITSRNSKNFNNDLSIRADVSFKTNQALIRKIQEQFTQATSGTSIVTLKFSADYSISRALSLRAFYDKIINKPLITSSGYPTSNTNYGISLKFTLLQ